MEKYNCLKKMIIDRKIRKIVRSEQCEQDKYVDDMVFSDDEEVQKNGVSYELKRCKID